MQVSNHLLNIGTGALGVATVDVIPSPPVTGVNTVDMALKIIIAVVSVLPSILSIFKKKKTN